MGSRRIKEHEETNITNVGTKSIVSEKEKKIRKKNILMITSLKKYLREQVE